MKHIPVLLDETLNYLNIKPNGVYLDMTLGGFGHGRKICERLSFEGVYIGLDKDEAAIQRAVEGSEGLKCKTFFVKSDFCDFEDVLCDIGQKSIDGCLMDLGVSSFQIDDPERGFSFMQDGPLDMRMDISASKDAMYVVNSYGEDELKKILFEYGEEKYAPSISKAIVKKRKEGSISTTQELVELIKNSVPASYLYRGKNPAAKTFQALRIEVNNELDPLEDTLNSVIDAMNKKGRLCVISFHSLEDRKVKQTFAKRASGCTCPKDFPVCVCGKSPEIKIITKNPVSAGEAEIKMNVRSRSAKMRVAEKL